MVNKESGMNFSESLALKLVSLLLALILWVTILGFKKEEVRTEVKFEPLVAPGMMITNKIPSYIVYTLKGPRSLLKDAERGIQPIRPDLRRVRDTTVPISISEDLIGEMPTGVNVVSYHPSNLIIQLEEIVEKYVPVKPTLQGLPAEGFDISRVKVTPTQVVVSGPRSSLDGLDFVGTEPIDTTNLRQSMESVVAVEVDPSQGFRLSREKIVRVTVETVPSKKR